MKLPQNFSASEDSIADCGIEETALLKAVQHR